MRKASVWMFASVAVLASIVFFACSKEKSFEVGNGIDGYASGTLLDTLTQCQDIEVYGKYTAGVALDSTNYALVKVNFTKGGAYVIETDTMNGYSFRAVGTAALLGTQVVRLEASGTPILPLYPTFTVEFDGTYCTFSTDSSTIVTPPPSGGGTQGDYFPMNAGNNYGYKVGTSTTDTVHFQALTKDSVVAGVTYRTFKLGRPSSVLYDTLLFRKSGNDYYQLGKFDNTGKTNVEFIMLKDNQPAGYTWETPEVDVTYGGGTTKGKVSQTILAKNIQTSINGNTFDSVIQVQQNYMYKVGTSFQTVKTGVTYYAKKVGIISWDVPAGYTYSLFRWKVYL